MLCARSIGLCLAVLAGLQADRFAHAGDQQSPAVPNAVVDLRTVEGVQLLKGQWRFADAEIIEIDHRNPGPDKKPSGGPNRTHDISPHAGGIDFDDSAWPTLDPNSLEDRRTTGKLAFCWYRVNVTIPERVGTFSTAGSTVYLEIVADDYAEVWVDGKLPLALGQSGGALVRGWNAPNRVLLTNDAKPGQCIQLAVFVANGPLSEPPSNYIWIRSATLDFFEPGRDVRFEHVPTRIERRDPAIDEIVPQNAVIEKLAEGFVFTEGPVWVADQKSVSSGHLLFSDPNKNVIHRFTPATGEVAIFRTKSGYAGVNIGEYRQPGSNGLTVDAEGRLTICEHGNRRVSRLEKNGTLTVMADRYDGKRLNSPNDLVYRSDGALYFTDPPFGLPNVYDDSRKELPYFGVFCLYNGALKLVSTALKGPNGIAFSPDEKFLYIANWDEQNKIIMRYDVQPDGELTNGRVFFDMTAAPGEEALDGLKVDQRGNVFCSGPGGVWIISADGKHLGTIIGPELPANFAWGDSDYRTLYLAARTGLYRIRMLNAGSVGIASASR
jgi:gluconolactonase